MPHRDPSLPTYAQYDGTVSRLCDFLGINTGSTRGNYEALRKLLKDKMNQCASVHGVPVNAGGAAGRGHLGFSIDKELLEKQSQQREEGMLL